MMEIRRISEFQSRIYFPDFAFHYEKYLESFRKTELGQIHSAIPWKDIVRVINLEENSKGPQSPFSPKGKITLMCLTNCSIKSDKRQVALKKAL